MSNKISSLEKAIEYYERAIKVKDQAYLHANLSYAYSELFKYETKEKRADALENAISEIDIAQKDSSNKEYKKDLIRFLLYKIETANDNKEALLEKISEIKNTLLKFDPEDIENKGLLERLQNNINAMKIYRKISQKALETANSLLKLDKEDIGSKDLLAQVYLRCGDFNKSLEVYDKLSKKIKDSDYGYILSNHAYVLSKEDKQKYLDKEIELLEKAISLGENPYYYISLSDCYIRKGDLDKALSYIKKFKLEKEEISENTPFALENLIEIYHKQEKNREFRSAITKFISLIPNFKEKGIDFSKSYTKILKFQEEFIEKETIPVKFERRMPEKIKKEIESLPLKKQFSGKTQKEPIEKPKPEIYDKLEKKIEEMTKNNKNIENGEKLWKHLKTTVRFIEIKYEEITENIKDMDTKQVEFNYYVHKCAALGHDIERSKEKKDRVKRKDFPDNQQGYIMYKKEHARLGSEIMRKILEDVGADSNFYEKVRKIVKYHDTPAEELNEKLSEEELNWCMSVIWADTMTFLTWDFDNYFEDRGLPNAKAKFHFMIEKVVPVLEERGLKDENLDSLIKYRENQLKGIAVYNIVKGLAYLIS